jgi:hypothetical protein
VASLYLSTDNAKSETLLKKMDTDYLIVDDSTLRLKQKALAIYAAIDSKIPLKDCLGYQLYYEDKVPPCLLLEYQNASLKIYKYTGGR